MLPALKAKTAGAWEVVAASQTGSRHLKQGKGCQDAWLAASRQDGTLLLAVADGAGSAAHAAEASALAVRTALMALSDLPDLPARLELAGRRTMLGVLKRVRGALEEAARGNLRDFSTTLAFAALSERWLAALHLGDGAVVAQTCTGEAFTLSAPRRGAYAGETVFVTSAGYLAEARCAFLPAQAVRGVALFTDGLEAVALELATMRAYGPFFKPLFAFAASPKAGKAAALEGFLGSERLAERSDDDKTLVVAARSPSADQAQATRSPSAARVQAVRS